MKLGGAVPAAAVLLVAGCASTTNTPAAVPQVPTTAPLVSDGWHPGKAAMLAELTGVLRVTLTPQGACAWLGDPGTPQPMQWPEGWVATSTGQVLDDQGQVVATAGQRISVGGGITPVAVSARCGTGQTWAVEGPIS